MKCIVNTDRSVKRVRDFVAEGLIGKGWEYCAKTEWKAATRNSVKSEEASTGTTDNGKKKTDCVHSSEKQQKAKSRKTNKKGGK
jgi:hypothetical protein